MMGLTMFASLSLSTAIAARRKSLRSRLRQKMPGDDRRRQEGYNANMVRRLHKIGDTGGESGPALDKQAEPPNIQPNGLAEQIKTPNRTRKTRSCLPMPIRSRQRLDNLVRLYGQPQKK